VSRPLSVQESEELRSGATSPEQVWARLRDCPPGWRRFLLRRCLESLRELGRLGEEIRALELSGGGAMRAWELALGRRWAEAGGLEQADDIFWLTAAEVERGLVSAAARNTLPVTVRARKAEYEEYRQLEMPGLLREGEMARLHPQMQREMLAEGGVLIGVPVNPGMAQGPVLVICGSQDFVKMKKGAIIVAPVADSSWVSLFPSAAGLIVETGGLLSHGATLAREYRLPMISAVAGATKRLRDGDQVLLDGSTGVVQVLAAAGGISTEEVQDEPS
jgi:phosphohistidine swiveling domain-containing protein